MGSPRRKLVKDHHQLVLGEIDVPVNLLQSEAQGLYRFSESESSGSEEAAGLAKNWKDVSVGIGTALTVNLAINKLKRGITEKQRVTSADKLGNGVVGYGRVRDHYPTQLVRRLANVGRGGDGDEASGNDGAVEDPSVIYHEKDNELPTREARMAARVLHLSPVKGAKRFAALTAGRSVTSAEDEDHPLLVSPSGKFSVLRAAMQDLRETRERVTMTQTLGIRASPRAVPRGGGRSGARGGARGGERGSPRPGAPPTPTTPSVGRKAIMKPVDTPHPRLLYEDADDDEIELLVSEENEMAARAEATRGNRSRPTSRASSPAMSRSVSINDMATILNARKALDKDEAQAKASASGGVKAAAAGGGTDAELSSSEAEEQQRQQGAIARQPSVTFLTPPRQAAAPHALASANRPPPMRAAESAPQLLSPALASALSAAVATRRIRRRVRRKKLPAERTNVVDPPRIMVLRPSVHPKGKQDYSKIKPRVPTRTGKVYKQPKREPAPEPAPSPPAAPARRPLSAHVPRARVYRPPSPKKITRAQPAGPGRPASAGERLTSEKSARPQSAHVDRRRSPYEGGAGRVRSTAARPQSARVDRRAADGADAAGRPRSASGKGGRPQSAHVGRRSPYAPASPRSSGKVRRHSTATASRFADGAFPPSPKVPGQPAAVAARA